MARDSETPGFGRLATRFRPLASAVMPAGAGAANTEPRGASDRAGAVAAALRQELPLLGGCLLMFWMLGAAPTAVAVITGVFFLVAAGKTLRKAANRCAADMPKRSPIRFHLTTGVSLGLFCVLLARACYIATVIVDTCL